MIHLTGERSQSKQLTQNLNSSLSAHRLSNAALKVSTTLSYEHLRAMVAALSPTRQVAFPRSWCQRFCVPWCDRLNVNILIPELVEVPLYDGKRDFADVIMLRI